MNLKWEDINSTGMDLKGYLDHIKENEDAMRNYKEYNPNPDIIEKIKSSITQGYHQLKILAIGADWCKDCKIRVPQMTKIIEEINEDIRFKIVYGVKTNPFHKEDEPLWHQKYSPPEATDPKFDLKKIPTIYFFDEKGDFINRIVEKPDKTEDMANEMLYLLKNDK